MRKESYSAFEKTMEELAIIFSEMKGADVQGVQGVELHILQKNVLSLSF